MPNYDYHPTKLSSEDVAVIVKKYRENKKVSALLLSKEYNCSSATISKFLRSNIPTRRT